VSSRTVWEGGERKNDVGSSVGETRRGQERWRRGEGGGEREQKERIRGYS
jgi:hypothetical protein